MFHITSKITHFMEEKRILKTVLKVQILQIRSSQFDIIVKHSDSVNRIIFYI